MRFRSASIILLSAMCTTALAQDAGALYKTKCATCHGAQGQGKPQVAPKLAATSKSEADIVALLTKGGGAKAPHLKSMSLTAEQAKAVADFVKTLK
ncbi:MAG TPA: cytochrome c [Acidisarcina sp.]|nr:cytochrome c [Acidisarcina sp.]